MLSAFAIPVSHPLITSPVAIFFVVLLIILITPLILNKLKIPHVIGLIVAGVLVGPYGFNLLARDMSFEVFGQVGLLYLMFLAGIEIDMYHLKKNLRRGAVFGLFTFAVPLVIGAAASMVVMNLPIMAAMLVAAMFSSHTLIAYPIVSRLGLTKSPAVIIAIAGTIFAVLGSLMVLAFVLAIDGSDGAASVGMLFKLLGSLAGFCVVVLYVYPRLTRWFFKRFNDGVLQFIYILAMVFLSAVAAGWIGIEGVFGAFFAGLVLNRYVPARTPLMSRIEFVGNAIFIPYFLIGVGMLINIGVLMSGWDTLIVAAEMSCIAMAGKWLAAFITQKIFKMNRLDRTMIYQLTNAHTAVALAVVMIGYKSGLFDETILNGTIIMILITCIVSSIGTSWAATRMKVRQLEATVDNPSVGATDRTPNTLVAVDNPMTAVELVTMALLTQPAARSNNRIFALHVRNDNSKMSRALSRSSLDVSSKVAAAADTKLESIERYDLNFVTGVLNAIEERDVGEVIIGLHRRSTVIDSFFGDKLLQLVRATNRMVMVSRCFIPVNTLTRIVVTVPVKAEFETGFSRWVRALGNLARELGCRIIFCCGSETRRCIEAVLRHWRYEIRSEYRELMHWDDFILLSSKILDDDLFVVVNSRRAAISFTTDMDALPDFLRKNFASNNLMVIFPEQFGDESFIPTMAETLSTDVVSAPSPLWIKLMGVYRKLSGWRKALMHRNRKPRKIEL